jgi:hypothetical protein
VGVHVDITVYAEVQAESVLDNHLRAPISLSNPDHRAGELPDTDSFFDPAGHVFSKARALTTLFFSACIWFVCVPVGALDLDPKPLTDTCYRWISKRWSQVRPASTALAR